MCSGVCLSASAQGGGVQDVSFQKGAQVSVDQPGPGFYDHLFLVEKATGVCRPVIDLSILNGFVTLTKFWMETVTSVVG